MALSIDKHLAKRPSAWTGFAKTRMPRRPVGRPGKHPGLNLFYGYPAELIAEWCGVALSTAYAYKTGRLKPSKPPAKLFLLHRDRRTLTAEWRGWRITRDAIVDPEGNATSRCLLRNYFLMLQYAGELVRRSGD
jgi:hypothetical protein